MMAQEVHSFHANCSFCHKLNQGVTQEGNGLGPEDLGCHATDYFKLAKQRAIISAILPDSHSSFSFYLSFAFDEAGALEGIPLNPELY